jgi:hypothetical protein
MSGEANTPDADLDGLLSLSEAEQSEWARLRRGAETAEVTTGHLVLMGASSIHERSKHLLRQFAAEAFSDPNKTSPELTMWLALSIARYLAGEYPSLDAAFGLKKRGRPVKLTPDLEVEMAEAYIQVMRDWSDRFGLSEASSHAACRAAESAAYAVLYNVHPADSTDDKGSVEDGLTRVRAVLKKRRVYIFPN